MVSEIVINNIEAIDSISEYNEMLERFRLSDADDETKEAAITELRRRKSIFDTNPLITPASIHADIEAGAADIDDMGGF